MVEFSSPVAVPSTRDYAPPVVDFSPISNLANTYRQAGFDEQQKKLNDAKVQQAQQQSALAKAFPNGLPVDPRTGAVDYGQVASTFAKFGDPASALSVMQQQPPPLSPLFGGQQGATAPGQPQAGPPSAPAPLGSVTAQPLPPPPQGSPQGGDGQGTIASLASGVGAPPQVAQNVARAIGVGPSDVLTNDQQARASRMLQGYAGRTGAGLDRLQSAIYGQESGSGQNTQTSVTGARGGMQVEPSTFKRYASAGEDIDNPADNRAVGNRILADYWKRYNGDPARAAVAYFSGPGNVAPAGSPTPWKSDKSDPTGKTTSSYVNDVLRKMGISQLREGMEPTNARVEGGFSALPPSANAGTPRPQPAQAPQPGAGQSRQMPAQATAAPAGAPGPAGTVAPQVPHQPAPQPVAGPQPAQSQPAPQQPLTPQVPLPPGFKDPQAAVMALRTEAARLSGYPRAQGQVQELNAWAAQIEQSLKPVPVNSMTTLLDPRTGQPIYQGPGAQAIANSGGELGQTLDADANQYRLTGKLPPNMGRGIQGQQQATAIRTRAAEQEIAEGGNPNDWPQRWQNFGAQATGRRVLEQRAVGLRLAENEASTLIPRVREISGAISRTKYPNINSLILAAKKGTGDPNVIKLGVAVESLIPVYAKILKPVGTVGAADMERAHDILDKAWSDGQINAALDQMEIELQSAQTALDKTMSEGPGGRKEQGGGSSAGAAPKAQGKTSSGLTWSVE